MSSTRTQQSLSSTRTHPIYSSYCADKNANIYHVDRPESPLVQTRLNSGYYDVHLRLPDRKTNKHYLVHRFVYECFNGVVPRNLDVHHRDHDPSNNKLSNLDAVTHSINLQLRHGYGDHQFELLKELPRDSIKINRVKKNVFDSLFYVPSTDSFYEARKIGDDNVFIKKRVDKDGRIHLTNTDGKQAQHKVSVIKSAIQSSD